MAANHHHHQHHQILHELLKEEQEPFHLNTYINTKRSNLQKQKILDDLRSQNVPVLIHIPSNTAALLIEAASKIQRKRSKDQGFLGLFLKKRAPVKDHRNKKSSFALRISDEEEGHRDRSSDVESRFCWCSLGFSFRRRNASTFCSSSVDYSSKQDNKIINAYKRSSNVRRDQAESEGNEHSSPTSVLEQHFFEEDDERESADAKEDDDSHLESSYANVQRVRETLLKKLRRFEELAELDPMEFDHIHFVEGNVIEEEITSKIEENPQNNNSSTEITTTSSGNNKKVVFFGGIFKTKNDAIIDTMVELELKCHHNGSWRLFNEQVEDVVHVIEREMFELLIDELLCERVL